MSVRILAFVALCLPGFIGVVAPLHAQEEAFMIPKSDRVIMGELTLPDGYKTNFVVRDGQWVTVEDAKTGYYFGFSGVIDEKSGQPNFQVYRLTRTSEGTLAKATTRQLNVSVGKGVRYLKFPKLHNTSLVVTGDGVWEFASAPIADPSQYTPFELKDLFGGLETGNGLCCLSCDQRTVCAAGVSNSCGACGGGGAGGFEAY
jgi:hypothetical protein